MSEEVLINPVRFLGPVECDDCGKNLYMKNIDYEISELGQDGQVLHVDSINALCSGVCPKCGKVFELEKDGLFFRIKDRAPERFKYRKKTPESFSLTNKEDTSNPFVEEE